MLRNMKLPWNSLRGVSVSWHFPQKMSSFSKLQSLPQVIILLQRPQAGLPMWHLGIKVHPHSHGLGVLQNGWRSPERKIPHRNATGDKKTQFELVNIQTQTNQLWKQIMLWKRYSIFDQCTVSRFILACVQHSYHTSTAKTQCSNNKLFLGRERANRLIQVPPIDTGSIPF